MRAENDIRQRLTELEQRRDTFQRDLERLANERGDGIEDAMLDCHTRLKITHGAVIALTWVLEAEPTSIPTAKPGPVL